MPATRTRLLIMKVYENGFTWPDLENYFNINRVYLNDELKAYFDKSGKGASMVIDRINYNERITCMCEVER